MRLESADFGPSHLLEILLQFEFDVCSTAFSLAVYGPMGTKLVVGTIYYFLSHLYLKSLKTAQDAGESQAGNPIGSELVKINNVMVFLNRYNSIHN